jgi:hypothetical protein
MPFAASHGPGLLAEEMEDLSQVRDLLLALRDVLPDATLQGRVGRGLQHRAPTLKEAMLGDINDAEIVQELLLQRPDRHDSTSLSSSGGWRELVSVGDP